MFTARMLGAVLMLGLLVQTSSAQGTDQVKKFLNQTAVTVKATPDPVQKRQILDKSLSDIYTALERVENVGTISDDDRAGMDFLQSVLQEKRDELAGVNGLAPVPDSQLNSFADYMVQDVEQAAETITVSLVAALLIIIILILIV